MDEIYEAELRKQAEQLAAALRSLVFYKDLLAEELFLSYLAVLDSFAQHDAAEAEQAYANFNRQLLSVSPECSWAYWLAGRLLGCENPVARGAVPDAAWEEALRYELKLLLQALEKDGRFWAAALNGSFWERFFPLYDRGLEPIKSSRAGLCQAFTAMRQRLLGWREPAVPELLAFHRQNGYGLPARYKAMLHSPEGLSGIERLDPVLPEDLFDYSGNLARLMQNTEDLLAGREAAHVLLYGTRGCGKSSAVKAMLNRYEGEGLRLIEINPRHLEGLAEVMHKIEHSALSYILFIDDLSFRSTDTAYTELKSFLQGGAMDIPSNCRLYVTSNRRHLVLEQLDESAQEIYENDGIDERISLSDRFGLKLHFLAPLQREYLEVVHFLAAQAGLGLPDAELDKQALAFAVRAGHRSPREARAFLRKYLNQLTDSEH